MLKVAPYVRCVEVWDASRERELVLKVVLRIVQAGAQGLSTYRAFDGMRE